MRTALVIALALAGCNPNMDDQAPAAEGAPLDASLTLAPVDGIAADMLDADVPDQEMDMRGHMECDDGESYEVVASIFPDERGLSGLIEILDTDESYDVVARVDLDRLEMFEREPSGGTYAPFELKADDMLERIDDIEPLAEGKFSADGRLVTGVMDNCSLVLRVNDPGR